MALTLHEVAARLEVHYMTVYRWVRTGRLRATMVAGQWRVEADDLPRGAATPVAPSAKAARRGATRRVDRVAERMVAADEPGAWTVLEEAMAAGEDAERVLVELLLPAMATVGDRWAAGELTVGDEHVATTVARRLIARVGPRQRRPGRRRGHVIIGAAPGDRHDLATAVIAELLRGRGFEVTDLGADPQARSFADRVEPGRLPVAVVVGAARRQHLAAIREVVERLRSEAVAAPVVVGGAGTEPADVEALDGVHHAAGPDEVLVLVDGFAGLPPR